MVAGLALAAVVAADDLQTPGEQVLHELARALGGGDEARAVELLAEAGEIYRYPYSEAEAEALLKALGAAARSENPAVAEAALRALGRTGAPAAAAYLEPFLRAGRKSEGRRTVAAAEAAGRLAAGSLIPNLLDLAREGADLVAAEQALLALGGFAEAPRELRERAMRETLQLAQLLSRRAARWRRLEWAGLRALQRLSGRRLNSVQQFADWWRLAKSRKDPFG